MKTRQTSVQVLLPHELIHSLAETSSPMVWESIMLGGYSDEQREHFWKHCKKLDAWKDHPIFEQDGLDLRRLLAITLHGDGAVMKREDECFVFSMGSLWSSAGCIQDVLMTKWPIAIIPERFMRSKKVLWFKLV